MSEEQTTLEQAVEEETKAVAEEKETRDIATELQEFGRNLADATKAVLESPEAQEAKVQLQRGLESLGKTVNKLTDQARETKVGQKVESGVSDASAGLKERRVLETLSESVASALHTVNQSVGQAVEKAHTRAEEAKVKKAEPQQIEIVEAEQETADAGKE